MNILQQQGGILDGIPRGSISEDELVGGDDEAGGGIPRQSQSQPILRGIDGASLRHARGQLQHRQSLVGQR